MCLQKGIPVICEKPLGLNVAEVGKLVAIAREKKVYLLEDCTSPVVVPNVVDFTDAADAAYQRFAEAGMHRVTTQTPLADWPGIQL